MCITVHLLKLLVFKNELFCTDSANIFINPHPACCETEKGGEGERNTDRTVKGIPTYTNSLRQPLYLLTRQMEGDAEESPPHHKHTSFDQFEAPASNLEVVSIKTDLGQ
jgi:hypothetical protein